MTCRIEAGIVCLALLLAGCGAPANQPAAPMPEDRAAPADNAPGAPPIEDSSAALVPPGPGEEGGLPDDRTPLAEGPIAPDSAQGAAQIVQRYAALLEEGRFADAYALWGDSGRASDMTAEEFAAAFAKYSELRAMIGGPSEPEGAAGSIYVTVPLQLYGRLAEGGTFNMIGPVTLRRVNDVPGSTEAQRRWHISDSELRPRGTVRESE